MQDGRTDRHNEEMVDLFLEGVGAIVLQRRLPISLYYIKLDFFFFQNSFSFFVLMQLIR